ncbi:LLM class flavin-dependent oxidoreductase [Actinomadura luteofluorescens]|uniref:LLM class flavin-dependent oxidoreductase n=1 Tax=Actinomadura luteofluorescens TaxID=46163 RepID=UPI00216495E1|nr:LLM class flavin-dependent oxidoreductase [Actinomadura glauciflava]MCR3745625.1 Luciferase-like monooxygenase [Actinomadura glauciflava]
MTPPRPRRPLRFGLSLAPDASAPLLRTAQEADRCGLDLLGIRDRPYRRDTADALALMAAVLAGTSRIRVLPAVACLPLRPPAALAKAIATMDRLSGGRAELGLGTGMEPGGVEAYGGPRLDGAASRRALEEAVQLIRLHWSDQNGLRFAGEHYRFAAAQAGPAPAHQIGIWLGVTGPRGLDLAGRVADGWIAPSSLVPPKRLADGQRRLDEAALRAGREPGEIRRVYVLEGDVDGRESRGFLHGPPRQWIYELTELAVGHGVDSFLYGGDPEQLQVFAMEIVPAVREQVTRERAGPAQGPAQAEPRPEAQPRAGQPSPHGTSVP